MQFDKNLLLILAFEIAILTSVNTIREESDVSETNMERMALNFINMIEFKLQRSVQVKETELVFMTLLMKEIQRRRERQREANTVYWYLRQG